MKIAISLLGTALLLGMTPPASADAIPGAAPAGSAELHLDRAAVHRLIAAALPERLEIDVGGVELRIEIDPPSELQFDRGALVLRIPIRVVRPEIETAVLVRYRPEIEPLYGVVQLVAEEARLVSPALADLDLSEWIGRLPLPRQATWSVDLDERDPLAVRAFLQDVRVEQRRLVLVLGLSVGGG